MRLEGRPELSEDTDDELRKRLYCLALEMSPALKKDSTTRKRGEEIVVGFLYPDQVEWRRGAEEWRFLWLYVT